MITRSGHLRLSLALLTALALTGTALATAAPTPSPPTALAVEDDGADCPVALPGSTPANPRLPDPFTRIDGSRVTSLADWRCRRAEIRELAERHVYGDKPAKPASVTGTVSRTSISVTATHQGRTASFSAGVDAPSGAGPFPAVIVVGGFGADTAAIKAAGAAVISYDPLAVGREGTPRSSKQGAFYTLHGASSPTGLLAAWAWGASRIIDVIEQSGSATIRADGIGVTGCSRYGKSAFAVGAFDQRVALTMPIESGSAGAPAFRSIAGESGAQPLSSAYGEQPWLGDAFSAYTGNPNALPIDTHQVIGMIAPRGLLLLENPHVDWLAARAGSVASLAGAEVYKALGAADNISYWSDVQDGTHCASRSEWRGPIQDNIREHLLKSGNAPQVFRISAKKAGNLAQWRDWQTPVLTGGGEPTSTTTTTTTTTTGVTTTTTPPPGTGCTASASVNQWNGGFVATVTVTANRAITGWTVGATLPPGATITNSWNTTRTGTSGPVTFTDAGFNGALAAGRSTEFGYQATGTAPTSALTCTAR
ncbi:cellulose binding domain-containing protein [Actinosynnema mirum]|uniref:Cellulose-binding family II n=1 Tax=Actinosynnema mirum (strain ATCC 29888 / DSM 43827 / JCM 3225 / NBRC 14064 / NCIMB 13271 / NRRL B-12336 / IMRU 3971 / 101) TaxID=446462 RepID=C6WH70_ACTMD|nr:cellulose binding domain-containing protein [Actinosynnema mirum]ACU37989.1 cellulose-binding family II [Actinosynnema mirum DSM 43827]